MKPLTAPTYSFDHNEAARANAEWGMNCGPSALAIMLALKPDDVRSHIPGFDQKFYTSPTMMKEALASLGIRFHEAWPSERVQIVRERNAPIYPANDSLKVDQFPKNGLARIQWEGPWCNAGVPIAARYCQTHWVGSFDDGNMLWIFDVNAGWTTFGLWRDEVVPDLLRIIKRASGGWYVTHRWQLIF